MFENVFKDAFYALICSTLGLISMRLAARSRYSRILRGLGAALLFGGLIFTAMIIPRILWVLNLKV